MASASSSKLLCGTCGNKSVGVFKCEGCSQTFCRKHSNEHRDSLSYQLDEIILEHDTLQQTIVVQKEKENDHHPLIKQINQWEKDSIVKIRQTAKETRQHVEKLIAGQNDTVSSKLHDLAERLRKAREDDDFVETDLCLWTKKLQELKIDITDVHPTVTIREDPSINLISKLNITSITKQFGKDESIVSIRGNVQIEDNGHAAIQRNSSIPSYVRGRNEYSFGKYKIRFNVNTTYRHYSNVFGIISNIETLSAWPSSCYGWSNTDGIYSDGKYDSNDTNAERDLKGKNSFTIELLMDCDHRKIQYFNEETKQRRELNVNLEKCPFPWQYFFYLYSVGDHIRLL